MLQGWHDLSAIHWRFAPADVQRLLPNGFTVDTFDGSAWVGLIPFHMSRIRIPKVPPFGPLSTFPETNVRTYIIGPDGRRAVWFMSLDITRLIPTLVARTTYNLPYCWARMSIEPKPHRLGEEPCPVAGSIRRYRSLRRWPGSRPGSVRAASEIAVRIGEKVPDREMSELDHFLTARWALGSTFARRLLWARIDHDPWPIHAAELLTVDASLVTAAGLPAPKGDPVVRWSPGVEVRIERPRLLSVAR